ncbi:MAG: YbbR-like domain-containing protein [Bacteroidaceae bacterium]|nr:YbbR-like domain-containing protein [Bacteroidaceae bacterium]
MRFSKEEIQHRLGCCWTNVRNFLRTPQCREFLLFLFFVFVASTFWILQTLNDSYETEVTIPLRLKNLPDNVVLTEDFPKQIELTVKDKGTVLVNYMFGQGFVPVSIDFNDYSKRGDHVRILSDELQKQVAGQLAVSTTLLDIAPDTLELIYTQGEGKKLPVKLAGVVTTGRQYYLAGRQLEPDSVMLYAPKAILDTLNAAYTLPLHLTGVSDTVHRKLGIQPVKGARFIPDMVEVSLYADILTEKTVSVPVTGIGFPADKQLKTFPSKVNVTFQVGGHLFKDITADDFRIELSYDELLQQTANGRCRLRATEVPSGVNHVRIVPNSVEFLIEQVIQ